MKDGQLFINGVGVPREKVGQIDNPDITEVQPAGRRLPRDAAQRRLLRHARPDAEFDRRQHARVRRAGRPLFHDGRQPRQFHRQPLRPSASCRPRTWSAAPTSSSSRSPAAHSPLRNLEVAVGDAPRRACSSSSARMGTEAADRRSAGRGAGRSAPATCFADQRLLEARADPCQRRSARRGQLRAPRIPRRPRARACRRRHAVPTVSGSRGGRARRRASTRWSAPRPAPRSPTRWSCTDLIRAGADVKALHGGKAAC